MRIVLVGPEPEENLGLRHLAASLERAGHSVAIVPFATEYRIPELVRQVLEHDPRIAGLSIGTGGIEAALTSRYSPDGKVYLARNKSGAREILARSRFNIGDNIAYRLVLDIRDGRVGASWKNMLDLEASIDPGTVGHCGFFVDRGSIFVTDLKPERLGPV